MGVQGNQRSCTMVHVSVAQLQTIQNDNQISHIHKRNASNFAEDGDFSSAVV